MLLMAKGPTASAFHTALINAGFVRVEEGVAKDSSEVRLICSAGVCRKSMLAGVTVGIWIRQLAACPLPQYFNHCHIYGSLGTIAPRFADLRVVAGQRYAQAWLELIDISGEIASELSSLLTIQNIRRAYAQGRFDKCLISREAREFLHQEIQ